MPHAGNSDSVTTCIALALCAGLALMATPLAAQDFPSRPVRMIVPFESGGSADTQARSIGGEMIRHLGQPLVIENRTGAGGLIGADLVVKSKPDGYTVCVCATTQTILAPYSEIKAPYDAARDLLPVTHSGPTMGPSWCAPVWVSARWLNSSRWRKPIRAS